jgi:hypothetical protein
MKIAQTNKSRAPKWVARLSSGWLLETAPACGCYPMRLLGAQANSESAYCAQSYYF